MKKRRNSKKKRQAELMLKLSIFFVLVVIMCMFIKKMDCNCSVVHSNDALSVSDTALSSAIPSVASDRSSDNLIPFSGLSQEGIPTGCESVSTVSVLTHCGIDISVDDFIQNFLPCKSFYRQNGALFGADPNEYFAGNPYTTSSLGCYPDVIIKALDAMKHADYEGMDDINYQKETGKTLDALILEYIDRQIPVIVWVTIDMNESYSGMRYYLEDGSIYTWTAQEHCAVLCGYNEESYYIMDPLADGEIVEYPKELVETRYEEMGKNAVVIYE